MRLRLAAMAWSAMAMSGCQSMADPAPAVLTTADPAAMENLKAALARAMGQASVQLGPGDPTQSPTISVLPRPLGPPEDRSLALPTIFRLEIAGGECFVVRQDGGAREKVDGVTCKRAG